MRYRCISANDVSREGSRGTSYAWTAARCPAACFHPECGAALCVGTTGLCPQCAASFTLPASMTLSLGTGSVVSE